MCLDSLLRRTAACLNYFVGKSHSAVCSIDPRDPDWLIKVVVTKNKWKYTPAWTIPIREHPKRYNKTYKWRLYVSFILIRSGRNTSGSKWMLVSASWSTITSNPVESLYGATLMDKYRCEVDGHSQRCIHYIPGPSPTTQISRGHTAKYSAQGYNILIEWRKGRSYCVNGKWKLHVACNSQRWWMLCWHCIVYSDVLYCDGRQNSLYEYPEIIER